MSYRISTFEDGVRDRLSVDGSLSIYQDSINSQLQPVEDSPYNANQYETLEPQVVYDDTPINRQQRSRTENLPSYPSDNFRSLTGSGAYDGNPYSDKQPTVPEKKQPKYKYVVMPQSLLGIKLKEGETFVGNLLTSGLTGAGFGGVFGGVGSLIGAGAGIISGIFGGKDKPTWFDVVYKDALQEAFQGMGLSITDKPFGGNSLTVKSQFGIDTPVTVKDMVNVLSQFNAKLAQQFQGKPQIANGLAGVKIQDTYDKSRTLFRFAVQYPKVQQPEDAKKTSEASGASPVKKVAGVASLIGILLSLR